MLDIALDNSNDIKTSNLDIVLVDQAEQVRQQILIKLKLWTGEWFLDTEFGTPYLPSILGKQLTLSGAVAAIRKSIMEVKGVRQIVDFSYNFDNATRKLNVSFTAETDYGKVEVAA